MPFWIAAWLDKHGHISPLPCLRSSMIWQNEYAMSHSVKLTTPIPSPEDVALSLGVSRSRLDDLLALVDRGAKGRIPRVGRGSTENDSKSAFKKAASKGRLIEKRASSPR